MKKIGLILIFASLYVYASNTILKTKTGFYYPANKKHSDSIYLGFGDKNKNYGYKCHLANDYNLEIGDSIYSVGSGVVTSANYNVSNYGGDTPAVSGGAIIIKHEKSDGEFFYALYGHLKNFKVNKGDTVAGGQHIGDVRSYKSNGTELTHLHFGINEENPTYAGYTPTKNCNDYRGYVDPEEYLKNNSPKVNNEVHKNNEDPFILINNNKDITIDNILELSDGVWFYEDVEQEVTGFNNKYNLIVIDRSKAYRLRTIVDFSKENKGYFKSHSVMNHIKNKGGKIVIGAINGDMFSNKDGSKKVYKENKTVYPERTFLYNGIDLKYSTSKEPIISFSNNYKKLDIDLSFHNIGKVNSEHDFVEKYKKYLGIDSYKSTNTSYIINGTFQESGKTDQTSTPIDWSMGLTQGSVWGYRYKNGEFKDNICANPTDTPNGKYLWSHAPMIAFNEDYAILAVSKKLISENQDVCDLFKVLKMDYVAYLDAGGSTQMVIKKEDEYQNKSPDNNDRAILSALAIVKAYPDVSKLDDEYQRAIYYLTDFGVFSGDDKGKFNPDSFISRAETSKIIIRLLELMGKNIKAGNIGAYKDIHLVSWFEPYAKKMVGLGLMEGYTKDKLDPKGKISYMELSKIMAIAFNGINIKVLDKKNDDWSVKYFNCLDNYGKNYIDRFRNKYGIFDLDNESWEQPTENETIYNKSREATRKDVALFLYRAFILWQDGKFDESSSTCVNK